MKSEIVPNTESLKFLFIQNYNTSAIYTETSYVFIGKLLRFSTKLFTLS